MCLSTRGAKDLPIPQQPIVKGDCKSLTIAAASILAKTVRDALINRLDAQHPGYGFAEHKGYPVEEHLAGLELRRSTGDRSGPSGSSSDGTLFRHGQSPRRVCAALARARVGGRIPGTNRPLAVIAAGGAKMDNPKNAPAVEANNRDRNSADWVTHDETIARAQTSTLCDEARKPFDPKHTEAEASKWIDEPQAEIGRVRDQ